MWTLVSLQYAPVALIAVLREHSVAKCDLFETEGIAKLLWSLAVCNNLDLETATAFSDMLVRRDLHLNEQELAMCMWAFATANIRPSDEVLAFWCPQVVAMEKEFSVKGKSQLHQAFMHLDSLGLAGSMPARLQVQCKKSFTAVAREFSRNRVAQHQRSVANCLRGMGHKVEEEAISELGYSLDMRLGDKVAIEVDGPSHFFDLELDLGSFDPELDVSRDPQLAYSGFLFEQIRGRNVEVAQLQKNGGGLLKDRLLQRAGWQILHVHWYDWSLACYERSEQKYLKSLLDTIK
jgi:very-short-patch-repair endonuclease